jgi:predicted nucleic acid-binding protein
LILVDTDALIDSLREGKRLGDAISVLTALEYLRGISEEEREEAKRLLEESFDIIGLDNSVILKYCELYEKLRSRGEIVSDADLIIGATAIAKKMKLLTRNYKHFEKLEKYGLILEK